LTREPSCKDEGTELSWMSLFLVKQIRFKAETAKSLKWRSSSRAKLLAERVQDDFNPFNDRLEK
jgi:hypothetical protein